MVNQLLTILAKIAEPTTVKNSTIFNIAPIHLNQLDGSFLVKLSIIIIIPVKQNN